LADVCVARRLGLQDRIPLRPTPPEIVEVRESAVVVRRGDTVLLTQRPPTGRWASMWEFPHGELREGETHESAALRLLAELTGLDAALGTELLTVRHAVTRFRITMGCFEAAHRGGTFRSVFYPSSVWLRPEELHGYPVSVPQRKLAKLLVEGMPQRQLF
jgi:A/G-specific adenine glycosylase